MIPRETIRTLRGEGEVEQSFPRKPNIDPYLRTSPKLPVSSPRLMWAGVRSSVKAFLEFVCLPAARSRAALPNAPRDADHPAAEQIHLRC